MRDTPDLAERDFFIDALRVASVLVVVLGHWFTTTVIWEDGSIGIENALSVIRSAHVATWMIQVMPLLFFVGGFSNLRSLEQHHDDYLAFLRTRFRRLLTPTLVFVGVWLVIGVLAELLIDTLPNVVDRAADLAALPFWFLGLYLFVVALAPLMLRLHRHWGWRVVAGMGVGVVAVDIVYHGFDVTQVGVLNYAFVWLLAHQLGYLYADGTLVGMSRRSLAATTLVGLAGLVALTTIGSYPVSMVGVPGDERWNTNPPSLALVMLTVWLVGLALLLRPWVLPRRGSGRLVTGANRVVLTVFLWHVTAVAVAAIVLHPLGLPDPEIGTTAWWALRPVWMAALVPVMGLLVVAFRRFEIHPQPECSVAEDDGAVRVVAAAVAAVSIGLGILGFGVTGFNRITADLGEGVLGFDLNPLHNVLHLVLGLGLMTAVYQRSRDALIGTLAVGFWYFAVGLIGWSSGIRILGMNRASAALHVVLGALGVALAVWAVRHDRKAGPSTIGRAGRI